MLGNKPPPIPEEIEQVSKQVSSDSSQIHSSAEGNSSELRIHSQTHKFKVSMDFFQQVLREKGLKEHVDNKPTLYLTDLGGQPEFQDLLPALVVGPCIFIIVVPLNKDLWKGG